MAALSEDVLYERTWYGLYQAASKLAPADVALVHHRGPEDQTSTALLHSELLLLVDSFAADLQSLGVDPQQVAGLHMERGINFSGLLLACSKLGAYAMPMPREYPSQRLLNIANNSIIIIFVCIIPISLWGDAS